MRAFVLCVMLAACVTSPPPPERVAGCWIARGAVGSATTMRWLPGPDGALTGDLLRYAQSGVTTRESYRLQPNGEAWTLCQSTASGEACWRVAQGQRGSLQGGRAFIDSHRDRLRIAVVTPGAQRVVFDGARDGCD